ncbi:MAG TPA: CNNM domain-containing protein, partial [Verrucomicrobiae bacterium]|nr:CNNM domain-containing protein [Verrucomicrobiae bacterium]
MEGLTANLLRVLGVLALVLTNGFFVAAELALIRIRDTQLEPLVAKGHRRARIARRLVQNLDATISAIQFGITLASLGLGVLVAPVFEGLLKPIFDALSLRSET